MNFDAHLDDVVLFEIPAFEDATELCARLAVDWFAWVQAYDDLRFVAAMPMPDEDDLAVLLRTVQRWGAEHGRPSIPFELDGRRYVLDTEAQTSVAA